MSQQTPLRRWQISVLMPSRLSRYCCLNFLLSIAPHHRLSLQNGYPEFPLILTPKQIYFRGNNKKYWFKLQNFISIAEIGRNKGIPQIKIWRTFFTNNVKNRIFFFFANFIHFKDENQIKANNKLKETTECNVRSVRKMSRACERSQICRAFGAGRFRIMS